MKRARKPDQEPRPNRRYHKSKAARQAERRAGMVDNICSGFFMVSVITMLSVGRELENTIGGLRLFWISFGLGSMLGLLVVGRLRQFSPPGEFFRRNAGIAYLLLSLGFGSAAVSVATVINRTFGSDVGQSSTYTIYDKLSSKSKSGGITYYLIFDAGGHYERLEVEQWQWESIAINEQVVFSTRRGYFGFPFVHGIEKIASEPMRNSIAATRVYKVCTTCVTSPTHPGA